MKTYYIYTISNCTTTYEVEAESKEEARKQYENGELTPIGEDFDNEEIVEIEEVKKNNI